MKLYIAVCCKIEYGTAAPSCLLLVYGQFSTVLKPIMTLVAEKPARWQCQFFTWCTSEACKKLISVLATPSIKAQNQ